MKALLGRFYREIAFAGNKIICPLCGFRAKSFLPGGLHTKRKNAKCPRCGCVERHRILWRFFINKNIVLNEVNKSLLHFAPEPALEKRLKAILPKYKTSDFGTNYSDYSFDLTKINCPDNQWDYLICFHVLEHVCDDREAMREMYRVLRPGGTAFIQAPIWPSESHQTFENSNILDPRDRQITFGQDDHLRIYGLDIIDRLEESGFAVEIVRFSDFFHESEINLFALTNTSGISEVFFCCSKYV